VIFRGGAGQGRGRNLGTLRIKRGERLLGFVEPERSSDGAGMQRKGGSKKNMKGGEEVGWGTPFLARLKSGVPTERRRSKRKGVNRNLAGEEARQNQRVEEEELKINSPNRETSDNFRTYGVDNESDCP